MTEQENQELLRRSIAHFQKQYGMKPLSLEEIGQVDETTITIEFLRKFAPANVPGGRILVDYFPHSSQSEVLRDLRVAGFPEYTIQRLVEIGYLAERNRAIVPLWEEHLKESLAAIKAKYGKRKTQKLKQRLGIR